MALIYHSQHGVITCVCGELITGKHTCDILISKIEVVVCDFYSRFMKENDKVCRVCLVKEGEKRYEDQWETDESGYCICAEYKLKCDGCLPKRCDCHSYIDTDGTPKCKGCNEIWVINCVYATCEDCGYHGD